MIFKKIKLFFNSTDKPAGRALLLILIVTIIASITIAVFESGINEQFKSFWDAVWWVMVTISTVGYGDKVPVTSIGKIVAVVIMFIGVALLSVVTATISSILVTKKLKEG